MINFIVGGLHFCLSVEDIKRFPDSYFSHLLKDEWNADQSEVVMLDRDGQAFRSVHFFIMSGLLDNHYNPLDDVELLVTVLREADFFNLPELVRQCNSRIRFQIQDLSEKLCLIESAMHECVVECADSITDSVLMAMHPYRAKTISTTSFTVAGMSLATIAQCADQERAQDNYKYLQHSLINTEHTGCFIISGSSFAGMSKINKQLAHWPLDGTNVCRCHLLGFPGSCLVLKDGAGVTRRSFSSNRFLYVYHGADSGGVVRVTVNGEEVTISRTGDCMALSAGVSFSVDAVVDGVLALVEVHVDEECTGCWRKPNMDALVWRQYGPLSDVPLQPQFSADVSNAVEESLSKYHSIALCLNSYYSISYSYNAERRFETDPDLLTGVDSELYSRLAARYCVEVVSVCIMRSPDLQRIEWSCILDYTTDHEDNCNVRTTKIIAPRYGVGNTFNTGKRTGASLKGAILTAMLVRPKTL